MKDYVDPLYMEAADDNPRFMAWLNGTSINRPTDNTPEEELPF